MGTTTCIIQARCQSERLPNKVLMPLGGKPILQHVVERCRLIKGVDHVIVASPVGEVEDPIARLVESLSVCSFRGSLKNVLSRYWHAAQLTHSEYIMRVTADCPLLDPAVCSSLLSKFETEKADYGGIGGWPHGLDCEVFRRELLNEAYTKAKKDVDKEHVTLWMKGQPHIKKAYLKSADPTLHVNNRWVVDYPEDYEFMRALFTYLPVNSVPSWQDIIAILEQYPALRGINQKVADEWAKETAEIYQASNKLLRYT